MSRTNSTDYNFPPLWGKYTDEQKIAWFTRRRVYKQAIRQDTAFGREHTRSKRESKRTDSDNYRL